MIKTGMTKVFALNIDGGRLEGACFGKGNRALILLPGLSLKSVKGSALALAGMYRIFAKDYRVYVLDKKMDIPQGYSIRDMANDTAQAIRQLRIAHADVLGISQGGMLAQYLAIDYPQMVGKLALGVTASRTNAVIEQAVGSWLDKAMHNDFGAVVTDMLYRMYSAAYIKKYKCLIPVLAKMGKPENPVRFINLARTCLSFSENFLPGICNRRQKG